MSEVLVKAVGLKKYFQTPAGYLHAVDNLNLEIRSKRTLGVVGESGCGKSTLGRLLLRLIEPTEGKIYFDGEDIMTFSRKELMSKRQEFQMIFQDPYASLDPRMSVSEIISEPMHIHKIYQNKTEIGNKVSELMDTVGLSDRFVNSYPHELDGGRRQRIGIARALAVNPRFIVCDEPVSALDVSIQAQILNLLMDLQEEKGLTYLFITHNLSVVKHISNEIAVMYLGQCVEYAPSDELFSNPCHPYTKALLASIPVASLAAKHMQRSVIKGELSSPINPKPGCRFYQRCPYACEKCIGRDLKVNEVETGHFVMCQLFEK